MNDLFSLQGHTALITGASSGIGNHFAKLLAQAGANVVLAARRIESCQGTAESLRTYDVTTGAVAMDVLDSKSVAAAVSEAADFGNITILCNNAGVVVSKSFLDHDEQDWDSVLDTNLKGAYLVGQAVARHMVAHGQGGSIINTASMLSFRVGKHIASYVTSKAGLMQLTRAMAVELAEHNIRVNAIAPGYIVTDFNRAYFDTPPGQAMIKRIPQRRVGSVEDLDGALLLLASDASRYMTGSAVVIDGGHSINSV